MKYFLTNEPPRNHKLHGDKRVQSNVGYQETKRQVNHKRKKSAASKNSLISLVQGGTQAPTEDQQVRSIPAGPGSEEDQCEAGTVVNSAVSLSNSFEVLQEDGDDSGCVLETNVDNHSSFYNEDRLPEEEPKTSLANYGSVNINSTGYPKEGLLQKPIFSFCKNTDCQLCKLHEFTKPLKYTCTYSSDPSNVCNAFHWHEETNNCCRRSHQLTSA